MAIKEELNTLLTKKMDRKDFLKHIGIGVVAVTGLSAFLKALAPAPKKAAVQQTNASQYGYGGSVYGGTKNS